ncbi:MAG: AAA family ATPase [Clostridiaceae bacterium]|jgi:DNA repair exonuclease SbcCD ATPase subunit|nr:AAA family ATPase [Clostridiaceae bacterium]
MKIKKIEIDGFGKINNRLFTLQPGMNVFYGCNESGKSTVQSFIKGMFFGLKGGRKAKDGTLPPMRQYKPWVLNTYSGKLEYELDDGSKYRITRNFDRNTVTVEDEFSNNITGQFPTGKEEGVKFAEQHFGLTESCFERTVFIGQMQSVINNDGKKVIAERLTNIKQTGDEEVSFQKAINTLKDAQLNFVGSERTTTRPLDIINSRLKIATQEKEELTKLHENSMNIFLELDQLQKQEIQLKEKVEKLNLLKAQLAKKQEIDRLINVCTSLEECYKQLVDIEQNIDKRQEELDNIQSQLKGYEVYKNYSRKDSDDMVSDYANYKLLSKELDDVKIENRENEDSIESLQKELEQNSIFSEDTSKMDEVIQNVLQYRRDKNTDTKKEPKVPSAKRWEALVGLIIGLIVTVMSLLNANTIFTIVGIVISLAMGVLLVTTLKRSGDGKVKEKSTKELEYEVNSKLLDDWMMMAKVDNIHDFIRLKNMFEDKKERLKGLYNNRERISGKIKNIQTGMDKSKTQIVQKLTFANIIVNSDFVEEDVEKWRTGLETYNHLMQNFKDRETEKSTLIHKKESFYREASIILGGDISTLKELETQINEKRQTLENLKHVDQDGVMSVEASTDGRSLTLEDVEYQISQANNQLSKVSLDINTLSTRLENIPDGEMIQLAHEKVQELTENREEKVMLGKAFDVAIEVLSESSVQIQRDYSPYLNEQMGNIMKSISGGRYEDIMADDSLTLNVQTPDVAEKVIPEQLSSGTADQMYFALRLATVMLVEKDGEILPLFLDEPFVQYDEDRTKNVLELLKTESEKRQIILFTCKKREVELVNQIFEGTSINIVEM